MFPTAGNRAVGVAAIAAVAGYAPIAEFGSSGGSHVRVVKRERISGCLRIEELRVLRVRDLVGADAVGVADGAVASVRLRIAGVARIPDRRPVHREGQTR